MQEQKKREKRMEKMINNEEPESMKSINDANSRLSYLTDKVGSL
jgi:hypothetical protein